MARTPQDITDAELAVLQVLWEHGPIQIRRITEGLYPQGTTAQYATVQKLLDRLEAKDCVARDRSPSSHVFSATIDRDELVGRRFARWPTSSAAAPGLPCSRIWCRPTNYPTQTGRP